MTIDPSSTPQPGTTKSQERDLNSDGLLAHARTQWEFGDWRTLASLPNQTLANHPDQGLLTLLKGAALLQLGQTELGSAHIREALTQGCDGATAALVLASGVYNTLGRCAIVDGNASRVAAYFTQSLELSPFKSDTRLLAKARLKEQTVQVAQGLTVPSPTLLEQGDAYSSVQSTLRVERLATFDLGQAWSSNTVNTVIFRHHGILTWSGFQYTAFYVNETILRVVRRTLANDQITSHDITGHYNLRDAHNSISLGIDRDGYLHISYDHHATKLRYRRSSKPNQIAEWTDELVMTGANEDRVTYPTFILPRASHPLTMLYRDGVHNKGSARLKTYDEHTQSWADHPTPILSGADQKPWTSNAYWNHPAIGTDGSLHLSFVWRTHTLGEQQLVNNVNIGYAWSPDNGQSWFTSRGQPCKLPMTQVNAETVWPVSPGSNLINQTSMALDSHNRPHIVFYANDLHNVPQYQHLWFDGEAWRHQQISKRTTAFNLKGAGTLQLPICRPEILIDHDDVAYAIYRGDLTKNRMSVARLSVANEAPNTISSTELWPEDLGFAEPIIDRTHWSNSNTLTMLIQHNEQPNAEGLQHIRSSNIVLADFRIS